jgi:tol-pal system protein YbgF
MKGIRNIAIAGCSLFLLCQCATKDDVRKLNYQVRAVNQRVEDVKSTTVDQMQKRQASSVSKIDQVDEALMQLDARLEENAHQESVYRQQNNEHLANLQTILEERLAVSDRKILELQRQLDQLTAGIDSMQQARVQAAERRAREASKRAEQAKQRTVMAASTSPTFVKVIPSGRKVRLGTASVSTATRSRSVSASARPSSQKAAPSMQTVITPDTVSGPFEQAMGKFKNKKYKDAYREFEQVLSNNPKGEQAAQTLFYMGESLYNQGEYDLAILDYQKVISNHSKDSHTPAALLKQGMSFEKLTDNETAKIIYKKLINEYSGSREAGTAKERLGNL